MDIQSSIRDTPTPPLLSTIWRKWSLGSTSMTSRLLADPWSTGRGAALVCFFRDPDLNVVEVNEVSEVNLDYVPIPAFEDNYIWIIAGDRNVVVGRSR